MPLWRSGLPRASTAPPHARDSHDDNRDRVQSAISCNRFRGLVVLGLDLGAAPPIPQKADFVGAVLTASRQQQQVDCAIAGHDRATREGIDEPSDGVPMGARQRGTLGDQVRTDSSPSRPLRSTARRSGADLEPGSNRRANRCNSRRFMQNGVLSIVKSAERISAPAHDN